MAHIKIAFVHYPTYSTKTYNKISGKDTHTVIKKKKQKTTGTDPNFWCLILLLRATEPQSSIPCTCSAVIHAKQGSSGYLRKKESGPIHLWHCQLFAHSQGVSFTVKYRQRE